MSQQSSQGRAVVAKWGPLAGMVVLGALLVWSLTSRGGRKDEVVVRVNNQPITQQQLWRALERTDQNDPRRLDMEKLIALRLVQEELARHNISITQEDYVDIMQRAEGYFRMMPSDTRTLGEQTLDALILSQLIRQEAQKRRITVSPEELERRLQGAKDYILARTGMDFKAWLESSGETEADYKDRLNLQILTGELVLPQQDRKEFFDANKERLAQLPHNSESVIYRQIVVAKKEDAEAIRKELLAPEKDGADFAKIADERSLDPMTRGRGGMVGWAVKGKLSPPDPELEKVLFSLKPGEISEPLPVSPSGVTDEGEKPSFWRLVKVEKHIAPHEITMDGNADIIEEWMTSDPRFQSRLEEFYDNLRASASIDFRGPRYRSLGEAYENLRRMQEQRAHPEAGPQGVPPGPQQAPPGGAAVPAPPTEGRERRSDARSGRSAGGGGR